MEIATLHEAIPTAKYQQPATNSTTLVVKDQQPAANGQKLSY